MECPKCDFSGDTEDVVSHHTRVHKKGIEERFTCEKCSGKSFDSEYAYLLHKRSIHNESVDFSNVDKHWAEYKIVELSCDYCNQDFEKRGEDVRDTHNFCSNECYVKYRKDTDWCGVYVTLECPECGDEFERLKSQLQHSQNRDTENNFCSQSCVNKFYSDCNYDGIYYGKNWETQRKFALKRDYHRCRVCNISMEKCKEKYDTSLHVHHRTPIRLFDDTEEANRLRNLLTVCPKCHAGLEKELS